MAKSFSANTNLAWVRINDNRASEALPLLKRAAELEPKSAGPHAAMADAHRKLRNWVGALKSADAAIALDGENAEAHFHRACALARLKRRVEALAALRKAVELDEFVEFTEDLETEPDLKPLARHARFQEGGRTDQTKRPRAERSKEGQVVSRMRVATLTPRTIRSSYWRSNG